LTAIGIGWSAPFKVELDLEFIKRLTLLRNASRVVCKAENGVLIMNRRESRNEERVVNIGINKDKYNQTTQAVYSRDVGPFYLTYYQAVIIHLFRNPETMRSSFSVLQVLATISAVAEAQRGGKQFGGGGSGKYKATTSLEPSLARHTIYAPKSPPSGTKLPLITWGNSACAGDGVGFANFLTEVASHGYVIIVSGQGSSFTPKSTNKDMANAIDWAAKNPAAAKYSIDTNRIGTAGQSCGGIQALHVGAQDSRVKLITLFNSGSLNAKDTAMAKKVAVPIGYFLGGPSDIAYNNVRNRCG
jgi:hypothetical protein